MIHNCYFCSHRTAMAKPACCCRCCGWEYQKTHDVDKWTTILGQQAVHYPEALKGIFFMDGNDSYTVTLEASRWDPATNTAVYTVLGPNSSWSHPNNCYFTFLGPFIVCCNLHYDVHLNRTSDFAQIDAHGLASCWISTGHICPRKIMSFTMTRLKDDPDHWTRDSVICCCLTDQYQFRRIVKPVEENGSIRYEKTMHFDIFTQKTPPECATRVRPITCCCQANSSHSSGKVHAVE